MNSSKGNGSILAFVDYILNEWKSLVIRFGLFSAIFLYAVQFFFPAVKIETSWIIASLSTCGFASMFILMEIHRSILKKPIPDQFPSLKEAEADIFEHIEQASRGRKRKIKIDILANRLSRMTPIISTIIQMSRAEKLGSATMTINVFFSDPTQNGTFSLIEPATVESGQEKHRSYSQSLKNSIEAMQHEARECRGIEIAFHQYNQMPTFYGIFINRHRLYWGAFSWNQGITDWTGPSNTCFVAQRGNEHYGNMIEWVENRLWVLEKASISDTSRA